MDRLLAIVAADERFVGVTIGGSAARGTMDAHSDLDLVLVCRDGDHAALMDERHALAAWSGRCWSRSPASTSASRVC